MELRRLGVIVAGSMAAGLALRHFIIGGIYIATPSMEPKLPVGAHVMLDRATLAFREPRRGEIICFVEPVPPRRHLVKRVIAVPGDTVELRAKAVFLNGQPLTEHYARHSRAQEALAGDDLGPLTVPRDRYFVLGDNRDESYDSTTWKDPKTGERIYFIEESAILGLIRGFY